MNLSQKRENCERSIDSNNSSSSSGDVSTSKVSGAEGREGEKMGDGINQSSSKNYNALVFPCQKIKRDYNG